MKKFFCFLMASIFYLKIFAVTNSNLYFDGKDDFVHFNYLSEYNLHKDDFTIELEIYALKTDDEQTFISNEGFSFGLNKNGQPILYIGQHYIEEENSLDLRDEKCHHLAVVREGGNVTFYIDGSVYSTEFFSDMINAHSEVIVGASLINMDKYYWGHIDNLRWWNSARTITDINDFRFSCINSEYKNLILNLHLDEGQGQIAHDYSWLQNHGILGKHLIAEAEDPKFSEPICSKKTCCIAVASFQCSYNQAIPNYLINFTNNSQNAQHYEWYIDGMYHANNASFSYSFSHVGEYVVTLKAYNQDEECIDFYSEIITIIPSVEFDFCGALSDFTQDKEDCPCNTFWDFDSQGNMIEQANYRYFDRFGNEYCNIAIHNDCDVPILKNGPSHNLNNPDCSTGLFDLYFTGTFTQQQQDLICQIFHDIEVLINEVPRSTTNAPVQFEIQSFSDPNSTTLGYAASYYDGATSFNNYIDGEVFKAINGIDNSDNHWDGYMSINTSYAWYYGYSGTPAPNEADLYSVALHELLHALGFASLIQSDGSSPQNKYDSYDLHLKLDNGIDLINSNGQFNFAQVNPSNGDLEKGCSLSGANVEFIGTSNPLSPVHAPEPWIAGSSISHFETGCDFYVTENYIMNASVALGTSRRLTQSEINTLCDLGYSLGNNYGTTNLIVGGANPNLSSFNNCGVVLVGINDFETPLGATYEIARENCLPTGTNTITILEQDLIANDINAIGIENLFNQNNVTVSSSGVGANRVYTYTYDVADVVNGKIVLSYKPIDISNNIGNETFVLITIKPCPGFGCTNNNLCNLICNGDVLDPAPFPQPNYNPFNMAYHMNANGTPVGPPGWHTLIASPSVYNFNIPCTGSNCPIINYTSLPFFDAFTNSITSNPGSAFALYGCNQNQAIGGEAVMTAVETLQGTPYLLSLNTRQWFTNQNAGLKLYLVDDNTISLTPNSGDQCSSGLDINTYLSNLLEIGSINNVAQPNWTQSIFCFETDLVNDYSVFAMIAHNKSCYVDGIELIEDKFITNTANIQTQYNLICGQDAVLGADLCTVANMEYQFWDVSDPLNEFRIDGNTVTSSYFASNDNGSIIQLNNILFDVQIEMRRVFFSSNGVPIVSNACDPILPISIDVPDSDPTFTTTINCTEVAFSATTQTGVHTWDFGDGNSSNDVNPVHVYNILGSYNVSHSVQENGCLNIENLNINILNLPTDATFAQSINCNEVTFTSTTQAGTHTWDFGDGNTSNDINPVHTYTNAGSYTVSHGVSDNGCNFLIEATIDILQSNPNSSFTNSVQCNEVYFIATTQSGIHFWDFGDGYTSTDASPGHLYATPGTYSVVHTLSENGCPASSISLVSIVSIVPDASFSKVVLCNEVTFTPTIQTGTHSWNFGDGNTSTDVNPTHVYATNGNYSVTHIVSENGCSAAYTLSVKVMMLFPNATFIADVNCNEVSFTATTQIGHHSWNFGDGSTSHFVNPTHVYALAGSYTVTHTVTTYAGSEVGCSTSFSSTISVLTVLPDATFSEVISCDEVVLTSTTQAGTHFWDFGDGYTSTDVNPTHVYAMAGNYSILHTLSENGCSGSFNASMSLLSVNPDATFLEEITCTEVAFTSATQVGIHSWDFGDGQISSNPNPIHSYATDGTYNVMHTVLVNGCSTTSSTSIMLTNTLPDAAFTYVVECDEVVLTSTTQAGTHFWDFGDGYTSTDVNPTHVYTSGGNKGIYHTITVNGCQNTIYQTITMYCPSFGVTFVNPFLGMCNFKLAMDSWLLPGDVVSVTYYLDGIQYSAGLHTLYLNGNNNPSFEITFPCNSGSSLSQVVVEDINQVGCDFSDMCGALMDPYSVTFYGNPMILSKNSEELLEEEVAEEGYLEENYTNGYYIFPNPFENNFKINFSLESSRLINVFSSNGAKIISLNERTSQVDIDISEYARGVYFIQIIEGDQQFIEKIVKN